MSSCARAFALFIGGFTLVNLAAALHGFRANVWWIDTAPLPPLAGAILLLAAAIALVAWATWPDAARFRLGVTLALTGALLVVAIWNVFRFYALWIHGSIRPGFWIPLSVFVCAALFAVIAAIRRKPTPIRIVTFALTLTASIVGAPLAQMACFGRTDYRPLALRSATPGREAGADVIVVFGAWAYSSGRCSQALGDRVRTSVALYHDGIATTLLFSGAEGDGDVHETEAMRRLAVSLGVPDNAIVCDLDGVNTQATVANTASSLRGKRVIAVSHWYHLPRVKMCYQSAGIEVFTVPAREGSVLTQYPWLITREVAALWIYYARAVVGH